MPIDQHQFSTETENITTERQYEFAISPLMQSFGQYPAHDLKQPRIEQFEDGVAHEMRKSINLSHQQSIDCAAGLGAQSPADHALKEYFA